jgi:hypothetical protein
MDAYIIDADYPIETGKKSSIGQSAKRCPNWPKFTSIDGGQDLKRLGSAVDRYHQICFFSSVRLRCLDPAPLARSRFLQFSTTRASLAIESTISNRVLGPKFGSISQKMILFEADWRFSYDSSPLF